MNINWYGLVYFIGILFFILYFQHISKHKKLKNFDYTNSMELLLSIGMFSLISSRLTYCFVYFPEYYINNLIEVIQINQGGFSFFGGFFGFLFWSYIGCKAYNINWLRLMDYVVLPLSLFLIFGRVANFYNKEILGYPTTSIIGYDFGDGIKRHPSQLYAAVKDFFIFIVLLYEKFLTPYVKGKAFATFLILYGVLRFITHWFREPTKIILGFAYGEIFSIIICIIGILVLNKVIKNEKG